MALFGKKRKDNANRTSAAQQTEETKETSENASPLDLIKETMAEAAKEREAAVQQNNTSVQTPGGEMPTAEEIKRAQEIIAKAQAAQSNQPNGSARVGVNAPVNTSSLKAVINAFVQSKSQENLKQVMDCLQNPKTLVCVPAQIITSKENQEKMKQGGDVKLEGPVHINPMLLTDNTGKKVFPIFSGEDTIPEDLKKKTSKVNMPLGNCLNIMKNIKDVDTLALDPYTANIRIGVNKEQPNNNK